jgi:hypothetical protein
MVDFSTFTSFCPLGAQPPWKLAVAFCGAEYKQDVLR